MAIPEERIRALFDGALDREGAERAAYLEAECAGDGGLRARVEELLAAAEKDDGFLGTRGPGTGGSGPSAAGGGIAPGARLGPYELIEELGEGGFGVVFLAEQSEPVRRRVALKVIKAGMDTRPVIARFEQERQALALMDHPNIAKVFDAGSSESGRPYFVMELVTGEPITTFCDRARLGIRERLVLLTQVCRAVQHAHTKGVIHRDLKPANVLVSLQDDRPVCRVIDFGIAKAIQGPLTDCTLYTELRQLIGTPEYMSPEQAAGSPDIDTRSDVYALGVMAYEVLSGAAPFDPGRLRTAAYGELLRIIQEVDPPAPSTRLSQLEGGGLGAIAAHRGLDPARLRATLRGELDWIVMKALEKEPGRRYQSADALASDLEHFLAGEPVEAAPPGALYRLRKLVRRHRVAVVAGAIVTLALLLGLAGTSVGMWRARVALLRAREAETLAQERLEDAETARGAADRSSRIATAVTDFFTLDVLNLEPTAPGQPELTVREVLDRIPGKIDQHFKADPAVEGTIRERVGQLYLNMGDSRRASEFLAPAASLLEQGLGPDDPATLRARQRLGRLLMDLDRHGEAAEVFDQVVQSRLRVLGPDHNFTLNSIGYRGLARIYAGTVEEGLRDIEHMVSEGHRVFGRATQFSMLFERQRVDAFLVLGDGPGAERLARSTLDFIAAHPDQVGFAAPDFRSLLGAALLMQGRFGEALEELEAAWDRLAPTLPESHPKLVTLRTRRGQALAGLERPREALEELTLVYDILERLQGAQAARTQEVARTLAELAERVGEPEARLRWLERAR